MQPHDDPPPDASAAPSPTETVGATLRAARVRLGEELIQIAGVLRIRAPFLQAIEEGQFQALPGVPYAIGFVRTYAEHLGLDGVEMVRRFKSEAAGLERKTSLSFPSPAPEGRVPGTAALLISLVAVTVVAVGWYFYQGGSTERLAQRVPEVPERLANPSPAVPAFNMSGLGDTPSEGAAAGPNAAADPAAPPPAAASPAAIAAAPTVPTAPAAGPASPAASAPPGGAPGGLAGASSAGAGAGPVGPSPATAPPPLAATAPAARPVSPPLGADTALPPPPGDPTRRLPAPTPPVTVAAPATVPAAPATEAEDGPPPDPTALGAAPAGAASGSGPGTGGAIPAVPQVAAAPSDGRIFGAQNGDSRVVIKARGESWVQVRDATNTPLLTRVLRPGDTYRVPNQAGLVMMTGNAGVLDVFVDGSAAPSLGAVGAVRRNIALDAERLRAGTP
jgi:cytoskeletal protein RodZ